MGDDDMLAEVRNALVGHDFLNEAIKHAEDLIKRYECRFLTFKFRARCAVGKGDTG